MLAYQNLPNKTNKVMLEPPAIYEVEIPGSTYFPYAFIKSVKIVNRGATRVLTLPYYNLTDDKGVGSIPAEADFFRTPERWDKFSSHKAARNTIQKGLWHKIVRTDKLESDKQNQLRLVEAVIPDAYEVRITVESLLPETKNLLFHSTLGSGTLANGLYTVSMSGQQ